MNALHVKYLLVGGGLASSAAAEAIRQRDDKGSILLVSQEVNRPYHRPSLSGEYIRKEKSRADLTTFDERWLNEHHVELRTGRRVAYVDTARSCVTLDNGQEVSYDQLLLATGATPKPLKLPGANLPNVFYLRTIDDADRLHNAIDKAKREGRRHPRGVGRGCVAIVGGGLLGVELAASLVQVGLHVDLIAGHAHPWHKIAGETTGAFIAHHLEQHGVAVHAGSRAARLEGDGRVQRVVLASGESVECDLAIGAVGVSANREVLRNTPIVAETAILVDERCRTSVGNVFAAGDCAAVFDPLFGKHRVVDHWENAQITGSIAGTNMTGGDDRYTAVSHYVSQVFDLQVSVWGEKRQVHHRLIRGDAPRFVEFGIVSDGRVAQVIKVGAGGPESPELLMQCVAQRLQVNGKEELLKDPATDLSTLLES